MPFDVKFNDGAMATLRKNLAQWGRNCAGSEKAAAGRLTSPKRPKKTPTGKPRGHAAHRCVVSGGQWVNGEVREEIRRWCREGHDRRATGVVKAQAGPKFKVLKEGLDLQKSALDRALDDRLVSIRDYYARKDADRTAGHRSGTGGQSSRN